MKINSISIKLLLTSFVIILLSSCSSTDKKTTTTTAQKGDPNKPMPIKVEVIIATPTSISDKIEVPGTLLSNESTEIHPEISGRLVELNVAEGRSVAKGSLLAKIYDGDLQAQLRKYEVQLDLAKKNEERAAQLLKIQGISKADYDASMLNINNINADIAITRAAITKTEIRAPFSGRLGLKKISPGAFVTPQTILTTIEQTQQLKLDFTVPEKYSGQLRTGKDIEFNIDGSTKNFFAKVMATESSIEENTRSLGIRALVKSRDELLIPGAFAKVKIELGTNNSALMIPTEAILPQGRKKQIFLFKGGKALPVEVTTGVRNATNVEILTGLNLRDTVITTGMLFLKPGSDVSISKVINP